MTRPCLLWLIWQNVDTRQRYHVGNLMYTDDFYIFQYEHSKKHRGLKEALDNGYRAHLAFPDLKKVYVSNKLFGPFLRRLPNRSRPDFKLLLSKYGLTDDFTEMDLLQATGGRLATDSYELVQPVYMEEGHFKFEFHIAGWRYYDGEKNIDQLKCSNQLIFEMEPANAEDPFAVKVKTENQLFLGYVPAFFSEFVTRMIKQGLLYKAKIVKIDREAIPQLRVKISMNGEMKHDVSHHKDAMSDNLVPVEYMS